MQRIQEKRRKNERDRQKERKLERKYPITEISIDRKDRSINWLEKNVIMLPHVDGDSHKAKWSFEKK